MKQSISPSLPVLLVDDEPQFLLSESMTLSAAGISNIKECQDSRRVMDTLSNSGAEVIVLDMMMPHIPGSDLLPTIVREYPEIPVIIVTAVNEVGMAVECMKEGAFDYLLKPVEDARLVGTVRRAIELREMRSENAQLKHYLLSGDLEHPEVFRAIVTRENSMRSRFQYVEAVAPTSLPILITGETGVGKELFARALHALSGRSGEFVQVNVAGVDSSLFSDTLFGHKRGAYTGADVGRKGLIEQASGGTLFLDEIGDLAAESQVQLLRVLQDGTYYPLGSDMQKITDTRLVFATNRDIDGMQKAGTFRKDLYFRLKAHHIYIPPLRDRRGDLPLLLDHFLKKAAESLGRKKPTPPKQLITLLSAYSFPGNVRELEGMVYDAVSQHQSGVLSMETFRVALSHGGLDGAAAERSSGNIAGQNTAVSFADELPTLHDMEQILIAEALRRSDGNQNIASSMLGLTRRALNNRLNRSSK